MTAKRPRILIVEDEEGIRQFMKAVLESSYEVHLARDGQEGIDEAERGRPDLILLDLRMPGMHGLSVIAKLKANRRTSAIPIVVVSAHGETEMLLASQRAGAVDHVIKPFSNDELRLVIRRQLAAPGE